MVRAAFDRVKAQIGGCGIWCGSCAVGNGGLRELARRLHGVLDAHGASQWAPADMDYAAFAEGLETIARAAECVGCRHGGGRDDCALRACSVARLAADCTECEAFGACAHEELLQTMRCGARKAGLLVRDPGEDREALLAAWGDELPATWPSLILFLEDA
jgi:hypothetical protein